MDNPSAGLASLFILIGGWILYQLPLFTIAWKSEEPNAWLAFVPLGNLWLMCEMADKPMWWLLVILFVPIASPIMIILIWMTIAENTNKSPLLGLLMIFPLINIVVGYYLAFYEPKTVKYP